MKGSKIILVLLLITTKVIFMSCMEKSLEGTILFTRASINVDNTAIIAIDPNGSLDILTKDFASAMSPDVSSDGKILLFAGKRKSENPWEIYKMNLVNRKVTQITAFDESCLYPAFLPGERIVFSKLTVNDSLQSASPLYTCKMDGTDLKRITYNPDSYSHSTVLKDGRILSLTSVNYQAGQSTNRNIPTSADQTYMVMRPDGTKAELFYKGGKLKGKMIQAVSGKLFLIQSANDSVHGNNVISVNYNNPFNSLITLTSNIKEDVISAYPEKSGKLLMVCRGSGSNNYSICEFDINKKSLGNPIYNTNEHTISEVMVIEKHDKAKKLPSEVELTNKTGLLLCQDVNFVNYNNDVKSNSPAASIEIIGLKSSLGIVPVENDGSFFVKIKADIPFRIRILDSKGNVLQNSCRWIWLRPNERRGCVGCHEDPAQVPENRVPIAVKKLPVNIPAQVIVEKSITLEKR